MKLFGRKHKRPRGLPTYGGVDGTVWAVPAGLALIASGDADDGGAAYGGGGGCGGGGGG